MRWIRSVSGAFTGGALGAFIDSFNIWFMGQAGISDYIGIGMKPDFEAEWLYKRMIWGGIWMLLLVTPILRGYTFWRGIVFSLAPTAMMFFLVFPSMGKGMFGLGFGSAMPAVVLGLNFIFGIFASYWHAYTK